MQSLIWAGVIRLLGAGMLALAGAEVCAQSTNAAWLRTTNRLDAPHFWSAVDASNGPVTVLAIGDSMAEPGRSIQRELFALLQGKLGKAGDSWLAYGFPTNGAAVINPDTSGPLPTWWSFHYELPPGSAVEWAQRDITQADRIGVYWFAQPKGGEFTITVATNLTNWGPTMLQLDGWAASPEVRYTNFAVPWDRYKVAAQGVSGTNYLLSPEFTDTTSSGIRVAYLSRGGINLHRIFSYPTNLLPALIATLNPQLIVSHMKEYGDIGETGLSNRLYDLEALWRSAVTNGDVAYIGTPYDYRDAAGEFTGIENVLWREAAVRDGRIYLDCMTPGLSYAAMTNMGWFDYATDVHPNALGNQYLARTIWSELGFFALRTPRQMEVVPLEEGVVCRWASVGELRYQVQSSPDLLNWNAEVKLRGTGGTMAWTNSATDAIRFFRLSVTAN